MKHTRKTVLLASIALAALSGCGTAGQSARQRLLSPAVRAAWPEVKTMATEGANARHDADHDDAAWHIDLELIDQFDQGVQRLGGG